MASRKDLGCSLAFSIGVLNPGNPLAIRSCIDFLPLSSATVVLALEPVITTLAPYLTIT